MNRHVAAIHFADQPACTAEVFYGFISLIGFGIAEIQTAGNTLTAHFERLKPGDLLNDPGFFQSISGQIIKAEAPVHSGEPESQSQLPQLLDISHKIADSQFRRKHPVSFIHQIFVWAAEKKYSSTMTCRIDRMDPSMKDVSANTYTYSIFDRNFRFHKLQPFT
jgi:hypothetical protein